ncbi:SlyX protein [Alteromonadaceae bacterium 2753L.S.0a.02]|nr:SlyX protein [Alteromonadaceae bacterium 2753L.S.0a.02]
MSDAISDLQMRLAFQDETIDTLNQQLTELSDEVMSLQKQMRLLYKKMDDMAYQLEQRSNSAPNPVDEKPPHY